MSEAYFYAICAGWFITISSGFFGGFAFGALAGKGKNFWGF